MTCSNTHKYVFNCVIVLVQEIKNMIKWPFDKLSGCMKLNTVKLNLSGFYVFSTVLCMYEVICMCL